MTKKRNDAVLAMSARTLEPVQAEQGVPCQENSSVERIPLLKYFRYKYALERLIAALLLIPALPVIGICGLFVRITSRGPMIYRQARVGEYGKVFYMFKIRTMFVDAEKQSGPTWSSQCDPRTTSVGRFLRFLHLDELPQLLNVVKGEMAIIGPRPERPEFVKVLAECVENYADRLLVKPGITGLAQIYLPPDESIDCVRKKVIFDRAYIQSASPMLDLRIWLCTIVRIFGLRKGRGPKWTGLERQFGNLKKECDQMSTSSTENWADSSDVDREFLHDTLQHVNGHATPALSAYLGNGSSSRTHQNGRLKNPK